MKRKRILLALLAIFLIIQLIPSNLPEVIGDNPNDFIKNNTISDKMEKRLRETCYDCHSNETVYPWYSYVAPVKFLVSKDTREGREELNFSNWEELSKIEKAEMLDEISEEVEDGEMPMKIYPLTHGNAKMTDAERAEMVAWAEEMAELLFE
jgi:uncharacterized membrane protein